MGNKQRKVVITIQPKHKNKSFADLSLKQKDWMACQFRELYTSYLQKHKKHPNNAECQEILVEAYNKIQNRGIIISFHAVKVAFSAKLPKYRKIQIIEGE